MTVGLRLLAFFPLWQIVLIGAVILSVGFGGYLAFDLALASQLLPEAKSRGNHIGFMNTAIFLPMLLAPGIAGGTVLAAVLILPITSVR